MRHHFSGQTCLCLIFLLAIHSVAQSQKLDYKSYVYPDVEYKALLMSENLTLNNNSTTADQSTRFRNSFGLSGNKYSNKGNKQRFSAGNFSSYINISRAANVYTTNLSANQRFRNFGIKERFFEYGYDVSANHNLRNKSNKQNFLSTGLDFILKIGKGRIDVLNEVMLAEFIVEDLRKNGILADTLSQEVIFEFAAEIARYNFTRILDSRNYRVEVVKGLSFWIKNNFIIRENSEIELTAILLDNYFYANTGFRTEGSRISVGVEPNYSFSRNFRPVQNSSTYGGDLVLEYSLQKPLSRQLQSNFYGLLSLGLYKSKSDNAIFSVASTSEHIRPTLLIAHKLGFYPNSRTNVDITTLIDYQFHKSIYNGGSSSDTERSGITPKIRAQTSYFIDYRLRVFATFEILYYHNFNHNDNVLPFESDYVPDDYSYPLTDWYIGRYSDPSLLDLNSLNTRSFHNKVTYAFNAGFSFNIF